MPCKPAVVFALLFSSLVTQLSAIELGSAVLESSPNEPLRARVPIFDLGETPLQEVSAQMASLADLQRLNIELHPSLADLRLSVRVDQRDAYLSLTSSEVPETSNLHSALNIMWPEGRLLGEYAISLDSALFGNKQQVVNIARSSPENALGQNFDQEILTISPADTLWSLALRLRPDVSVTIQQTMLAIQSQNPEAFRDNNVNRMLWTSSPDSDTEPNTRDQF